MHGVKYGVKTDQTSHFHISWSFTETQRRSWDVNSTSRFLCIGETTIVALQTTVWKSYLWSKQLIKIWKYLELSDVVVPPLSRRETDASLWTLAPAGGRFPGWQHVYTCTIWLKLRLELQGDPILTSVLCIKGFNRLNNSDTCRIVHLPRKCRSCDFRLSGFLTLPDTNQFSVTPTTSAQIQLMIDVTTWKCWKSSDWLVYIKHFYSHQTFDPVTRVHVNMANVSRHCCWCIPGKVWQKAFMCEHAVILLKRTLRSSTSQSRQRGPVTVLPLPVTHQTSTVHRRSRQSEAAHQAVMHIMNLYHGGLKST